jgi:type III pantothenate kinase
MSADLLLVDVGNTRVKWATVRSGGPMREGRGAATTALTAVWVRALAARHPRHHLVLASVVPKATPLFTRAFRHRATVLTGDLPMLRTLFRYPNPAELGADRIAAALAVQAGGRFPAIVVACGTAVAFTVLDAKGRLRGGAIAPGLGAQLSALVVGAAQLRAPTLRPPRSALATSTSDAIRAGVLGAFVGGVKEIVARLTEALGDGPPPRVVLTGGDAHLLAGELELAHELRPLLVLEGLLIMGQRTLSSAT